MEKDKEYIALLEKLLKTEEARAERWKETSIFWHEATEFWKGRVRVKKVEL